MTVEVKLSESELDNALAFLEKERQLLYLPDQFEINALRLAWDRIKPEFLQANLLSYNPKACVQLIAPKQKFAAMPIHLPDPVDLILLTGLGLRLAPKIEERRLKDDIVFSWRFSTTPDGKPNFLSHWDRWVSEIEKRGNKYPYVAKADIVDFFPRIYLHRLENALDYVTGMQLETRAIMRFLTTWSHGTSYGIPIGPRICGILSEALLSEVDEYLESHGVEFLRYVDDYVFFAETFSEGLKTLYLLAERLQTTQGLSLNMAKTKILLTRKLIEELTDPSEKSARFRQHIVEDIFGGDPYVQVDYESLTPDQKAQIDALDTKRMLEEALAPDILDLPMVKFVLNVLTGLHRPESAELVIKNLERLIPAAEAVSRFLSIFVTENDEVKKYISENIFKYLSTTPFVPDYYSIWLLEPFSKDSRWNHLRELRAIARDNRNRLVRRQAILALGNIGDRSALLDIKSSVDDAKDWEWRAIIYACRSLPQDEREAFWRSMSPGGYWNLTNILVKVTCEYAKMHC